MRNEPEACRETYNIINEKLAVSEEKVEVEKSCRFAPISFSALQVLGTRAFSSFDMIKFLIQYGEIT